MALVSKAHSHTPAIYVQLSSSADYGFKQNIPIVDDEGNPGKSVVSHESVTGVPVGFYVQTKPTYDVVQAVKAKGLATSSIDVSTLTEFQKKMVAVLRMRDPETSEIVAINFDVHESLGGKIIGMLNTALMNGTLNQDFALRTFYAEPNTKYNKSDKGRSSVNMRPTGSKNPEDDVKASFLDAAGKVMMDPENPAEYARLPMGTITGTYKGKDQWEFSARDEIISGTALALIDHFKSPAPANTDDDSVDLGEAARAASAPAP